MEESSSASSIAPERAGDQARDDPSAYTSIQRRCGAGAWTLTRQDRGPSARYDRRQERPPLDGSHELRLRNVNPLYDNLPQPQCLPIQIWVGHRPTFDYIIPFATVGYMRRPKPVHQLAPRGAKCIMFGIDTNYPRRTFRIRDLTTGQVIIRQTIIWYPTADAREAVSRKTVTRGGARALLAATLENLPLHVLTGEPGDRLGRAGIGTA